MPTVKGKVRKEVDGHWHPVYGTLKAGSIVDVETGEDGSYPDQIFELEEAFPVEARWEINEQAAQAEEGGEDR